MSCPSLERLAAAASGEDAPAATHAADCTRCAALLEHQLEIVGLARCLPPLALASARKAELAAELLARADAGPGPHRGARLAAFASLAAAAAIAIAVLAGRRSGAPQEMASRAAPVAPVASHAAPAGGRVASSGSPAPASHAAAAASAAAAAPADRDATGRARAPALHDRVASAPSAKAPAEVVARGADFTRASTGGLDTIVLRDGLLAIDSRGRAPVAVTTRDTTIQIASGRAELVVHGGLVVSARAFAGSVEIDRGGARRVIEAGEVWTPPPGPVTSFAAFRAGWEALHAGRDADAIAAFDLATDPAVAEDAAFWAAVAAVRAGDRADAVRRLRAFLARYPRSPRADDARGALARQR